MATSRLTAESLPQFLRDNNKYFNDICFQLAGLNQWTDHKAKMDNKMAVLQYALLDQKLSKKLYSFAGVCKKNSALSMKTRYKMLTV